MKKEITYQRARELVNRGDFVICKWGEYEDQKEVVKTLNRLEYCQKLKLDKIRKADFYENYEVAPEKNCIQISFDEAYVMVHSKQKVFSKEDGEEIEISSMNKLMELRRQRGENLLLFWYE